MAGADSLRVQLDRGRGAADPVAPWLDLNLVPGPEPVWDAADMHAAGSPWSDRTDVNDSEGSSSSSSAKSGSPEPRSILRGEALPVSPELRAHANCHARYDQRDLPTKDDAVSNQGEKILSFYTGKRRRATEVHKRSEKRRRDRFNHNIKILQEILPNSPKGDKLSILDGAINYLKELQVQQRMLDDMSVASHAMPGPQHVLLPAMTTILPVPQSLPVSINIEAPPIVLHLPYFYL